MHCAHTAIVAAILCLFTPPAPGQAAGPVNLNFEEGTPGQSPPGWFLPVPGYTMTLSPDAAHDGSLGLLLAPGEPAPDAPPAPFGNVMQVFDATPFRGKRVALEGWVRCETPLGGAAQVWVRVDRPGGKVGFFDNMHDRPITAREWAKVQITGDIAADAEWINLGLMARGGATAFADGFTFGAVGAAGEGNEPPRAITGRGLLNLVALTRLSGAVRFFHPTTESLGLDWDLFMIDAMGTAEGAPGPAELAEALGAALGPIAPSVRVWAGGPGDGPAADPAPAGATGVIAFRHVGVHVGGGGNGNIYSSPRVAGLIGGEAALGIPSAGTAAVLDLGGGIACRVPVTLYTDQAGTLPKAGAAPAPGAPRPMGWKPSPSDRSTRLAAVMLAWNVIQNFYPYLDEVKVDWPAVLPESLRSAAIDAEDAAFLGTLEKLIARADDGHGSVRGPGERFDIPLDLDWLWVGEDLVISRAPVGSAVTGLAPGDVVQSIDGVPIAQCYGEVVATISAGTEQWRRHAALQDLRTWPRGAAATVIARRGAGGAARPVVAVVSRGGKPGRHSDGLSRPLTGAEIRPGIVYFDLVGAPAAELNRAMPKLRGAKGIIFDMRGYPDEAGSEVLRYLSDEVLTSAQWLLPITTLPNREGTTFERAPSWALPPLQPRLTGAVAFLTDGGAISYAESCMGIVEHHKLGEIVGGPTAGTNGNVNPIPLPGGYTLAYTGMKVVKQDGSRHHGIGILPTVPCAPTIEGLAAGRDEVLDRAIEVLEAKPAPEAAREP